ncbi:hypothetical protein PWT90_09792 [Aphanocladium album]|nr:hypothetical protein PWT90_09792 [Aphanocladium album]
MLTLGLSAIMIAGPLLVPRSRLRACLQILFCVFLFRLNPGLLPQWYYFPVTILAAILVAALAAVAAAPARRNLFAETTRRLPNVIDPALEKLTSLGSGVVRGGSGLAVGVSAAADAALLDRQPAARVEDCYARDQYCGQETSFQSAADERWDVVLATAGSLGSFDERCSIHTLVP